MLWSSCQNIFIVLFLNSLVSQFAVVADQQHPQIVTDEVEAGEYEKPKLERSRIPRNPAKEGEDEGSDEESAPKVEKKMPNMAVKYKPFELPANYNKLQIPSISYAIGRFAVSELELNDLNIFNFVVYEVWATLRILDINDVDEMNQEVIFTASLILRWVDEVIAYEGKKKYFPDESLELGVDPDEDSTMYNDYYKTLDNEVLTKIWKPDIFIEKLVKVKNPELMSHAVTVRINEVTGEVTYVSRVRIQMECEMDLHYYPADTQSCQVQLRSHSYSKDELKLIWAKPFGAMLEDCGGQNFDFQLGPHADTVKVDGHMGNTTRSFSSLKFNIFARRKLSYHLVQTFLPSVFFIIITWLCFLVPSKMVEARIGISMTTLLTLTAMFASVRESTPTVSYVRAIDIWMLACIFFVFLTLLEFTVLVWLHHADTEKECETEVEDENDGEKGKIGENTALQVEFKGSSSPRKPKKNIRRDVPLKIRTADFIEKYAFLIFSVIFIVFCSIYWIWLLVGSEYYEWHVDGDYNFCDSNDD